MALRLQFRLHNTTFLSYGFADFAPNNLLVKNTKLSTDKLTPHSAIVTVMLSNRKQLVSQDNSSLIVVNNNTPTLTNHSLLLNKELMPPLLEGSFK